MKLLFDQQLSPGLVRRLAEVFPESSHVHVQGFGEAIDGVVWAFARDHGHTIVTKDADFADLAALRGPPPKVVWLRIGNCTTSEIESLLRAQQDAIHGLLADSGAAILSLW